MRETEYRGKREDNGEWVQGNGFLIDNATVGFPVYVWSNKHFDWKKVNSETVGQYTGLQDRNGVKIFEGDIVVYDSLGNKGRGRIEWYEWDARFVIGLIDDSCVWIDCQIGFEVIGNIHDNPELLEAKE